MAYPEKLLADGEQVRVRLHPHWITLVPAILWFVVVCGLGSYGLVTVDANLSAGTGRTVLLLLIAVIGIVLLCWRTLGPLIGWRTTHYIITTHRVLIRRGVLKHTGRDIALQRINDVGFEQTLFDRVVGAGTLTIESAGEHGQERLINIPDSDEQQQLLNRLIEQDAERRSFGYGRNAQNWPDHPTRDYPPG